MNAAVNNPETTIYVGNIDPRVTKSQIYELFVQVSPISEIRYPKDKVLQMHQGYAFVECCSPEDAQYVIKLMNNTVSLYDRVLKVRRANAQSTNISNPGDISMWPLAKVFVKNLDDTVDPMQLSNLFSKLGPLARQPEIFYLSHNELRCAYIYFKDYAHADTAIATLNNQLVVNKRINLDYAFKENSQTNAKYGSEVDRLLNKEARNRNLL
ncbi:probable protein HSH49 [Zygosaccharomyces bailii]|nr:probable protein HSH49 [Zygosaccharomyces bailii]